MPILSRRHQMCPHCHEYACREEFAGHNNDALLIIGMVYSELSRENNRRCLMDVPCDAIYAAASDCIKNDDYNDTMPWQDRVTCLSKLFAFVSCMALEEHEIERSNTIDGFTANLFDDIYNNPNDGATIEPSAPVKAPRRAVFPVAIPNEFEPDEDVPEYTESGEEDPDDSVYEHMPWFAIAEPPQLTRTNVARTLAF
jgi:hypothetical protein